MQQAPTSGAFSFAGGRLGHSISPETRLKLSNALKGRAFSADHRRHQQEAIKKPEYRKKMSEILTVRYQDDELRKRLGEAIKKGLNRPESKKRHSESLKRYYSDPANRQRMSESVKQVPHTAEWNQNVSKSLKGRVFSVEHRRHIGESHAGEKNYGWLGGISFLPYSPKFNHGLKESIKARDNYCCRICGGTTKLYIHHIDYDKANTEPSNLISLCLSCHVKTNFRRTYWEGTLSKIMGQTIAGCSA